MLNKNVTIILIFILSLILINYAFSVNNVHLNFSSIDKVEGNDTGYINWSEGYIISSSKGNVSYKNTKNIFAKRLKDESNIKEEAYKKITNTILSMRVNSFQYVRDIIKSNNEIMVKLLSAVQTYSKELLPVYNGQEVEITLKYPLFGEGSLTKILSEIEDVQFDKTPYDENKSDTYSQKPYTSLIIDVRGLKFNPCLFPKIINNKNEVVYSLGIIPESSRGFIQYIRFVTESFYPYKLEKTGSNPYYVAAEKIIGENKTDILLNIEDTLKLFANPKTISNLKNGKVFIIVDK